MQLKKKRKETILQWKVSWTRYLFTLTWVGFSNGNFQSFLMEVIVFYLSLILQDSTHNYTVQINKRLQRVTFIWNYFLVLVRNSRLMSRSVISPQRPVWTWSHTWGWVRWGDVALASAETPSPRGLPRSPGLVCHQPFLENRKQNRLPWWSQRQQP